MPGCIGTLDQCSIESKGTEDFQHCDHGVREHYQAEVFGEQKTRENERTYYSSAPP